MQVKAADLPVELQTTEAVATPKGCAEAAAHTAVRGLSV
jgi:hypothetical protein